MNSLPTSLEMLRETPLGISAIVFLLTIAVLLIIRPPSIRVVTIEGSSISWWRVILFSFLAGAAVQIYPLFLTMYRL